HRRDDEQHQHHEHDAGAVLRERERIQLDGRGRGRAHCASRISTRRSLDQPDSSVPTASSSPREVVAARSSLSPAPFRYPATAPARRCPRAKLYSSSPRGSACPTMFMFLPLPAPVLKQVTSLSSTPLAGPPSDAELNSKRASGRSH